MCTKGEGNKNAYCGEKKKILRMISGAKKESNESKTRKNQELKNMYGQPEIIGDIKSKRLG
jgi:hypothetical protein